MTTSQVAGAEARNRHQRHDEPVPDEQSDRREDLATDSGPEEDQRGRQVTNRDPLEHARDTEGMEEILVEGELPQRDPQAEDDQGAPDDLGDDTATSFGIIQPLREGEGDRDADDEQEEWEDQVRCGPAVPFGVSERRIERPGRSGVVDQDHPGNRQATEDVERRQPPSRLRRSILTGFVGMDCGTSGHQGVALRCRRPGSRRVGRRTLPRLTRPSSGRKPETRPVKPRLRGFRWE